MWHLNSSPQYVNINKWKNRLTGLLIGQHNETQLLTRQISLVTDQLVIANENNISLTEHVSVFNVHFVTERLIYC